MHRCIVASMYRCTDASTSMHQCIDVINVNVNVNIDANININVNINVSVNSGSRALWPSALMR